MKTVLKRVGTRAGISVAIVLVAGGLLVAGQPERWLHVNVKSSSDHETVRVNLPLSLAEKVLPAINSHQLCAGRISLRHAEVNGVNLRQLVDAVRQSEDGEFVTVDGPDETVRVRKAGGDLLVRVHETGAKHQDVDIHLPFPVAQALVSGPPDQLDLLAAVRALSNYGDTTLVTVNDSEDHVRIWVDTRSSAE